MKAEQGKFASQNGMTLMEIMIAISILAIIATMIWTSFAQTTRNRQFIERSLDRYHQVTVAFEKITSDLSMAHISRNIYQGEKKSVSTEPGFIGKNEDPDRLDFTTFSHIRRYLDSKEGDRCEVGYRVEEDKNHPGKFNLIRRESATVDEDPLRGGKSSILVEDVTAFDIEYYDPLMDKWEKDWDTTQATGKPGRLPLQIRIYLKINDENGKEVKFATQLPLDIQTTLIFSGGTGNI
ncbi:MAG: type II secretion system protein GspJ [Candidatus Omnitrophica bacterium]|nr:type II secretion system protein GspJ [Candidatus Omnitrophota bacterium]